MSNTLILPYKTGSESASTLATSLGFKRMKLEDSNVRDNSERTIINWGNSTTSLSHLPSTRVINKSANVRKASHKGEFFQAISEYNVANPDDTVSIPEWTTKKSEASKWYRDGNDVVCRDVLQGHSGEGLTVVNYDDEVIASQALPTSLLYTKYVKKRDEYRVHVMDGVAFFVQKKCVPLSRTEEVNYQVRNHSNGFVFTVQDLDPDESILLEGIKAVKALDLDFGAADVIWNERRQKATVIEVNTACSVSGATTLERYGAALKALLAGDKVTPWDKRISSVTSTFSNAIGSEGYISINVAGCYEVGTVLSLDEDAMNELSNHWLHDGSANEALNYLFCDLTSDERRQRLFTIENLHPSTDWVQLSIWRHGNELPLPFWVHPSHLARYSSVDE